jgi:hypothetical protein
VGSVGGGEGCEAGAVEIDAGIVEVVGILIFVKAHDAQLDLTFFHIHVFDAAQDPLAAGDGVLYRAGFGIAEVKVIVAVALAGPEEFAGGVEPVEKGLLRVVHEGIGFLIKERAGFAVAIYGDDAEELMAALIVEEVEGGAVGSPVVFADVEGRGEE